MPSLNKIYDDSSKRIANIPNFSFTNYCDEIKIYKVIWARGGTSSIDIEPNALRTFGYQEILEPPTALNSTLSSEIGQIPEVEKIFVFEVDDIKHVYTIINDNQRTVKRSIYEKENSVINLFQNEKLDFHVIWREERDLNSIINLSEPPIFER